MPTSQAQFRHHPLYVLPKFIGKYEIIWPEDAEPAGTFKEMPVYWRKNLYKLHTKDKWVQEGRQVRVRIRFREANVVLNVNLTHIQFTRRENFQ